MSNERRSLPSPLRGVLGIQTRLGLAFAVILLLFAGSALMFRAALTEVEEARQATDHSELVLQAIDSLLVLVLDQETGLRGYLLSSRDEFLEPYRVGGEQFEKSWRELKALTADNPNQQAPLEQWRDEMRRWRGDFAELVLDYKRRNDEASELALVRTGKGKRIVDGIRVLVQQMRDHERSLLHERSSRLQARLDRTRELTYLMLLAGIAFVALAMWAVARTVTRPVTQLTSLMSRLSSGETDVDIPYRGHGDEIGALARGLEVFRRSTVDLAGREWIKTELASLSVALQGCTTLAEFGERLSERLSLSGGAVCTVFFRWDEARERYEPSGSYSLPGGSGPRGYSRGEGLVGQVAQDGEPRVVRDLPESYLRVRSGLGEVVPPSLRLLPLPGRERVLGVVEMAYFADPGPLQAEFLKQAAGYAALVLETLERGLATMELLRQTQYQKEELQASEEALRAQQEELRATNEALRDKSRLLEEQSQKLRASEEELRVQAEELRIANVSLEEKSEALHGQKQALERAQAELEEKAVDLEQASRYKSEFLANMSHELRTPLNSLLILSKGLAENEEGNLTAEQIESASIVHDSGRNLLNLINDILDLSKVEAGKMQVVLEDVNLAALAAGIERNFRALAEQRHLTLEVSRAPGLPATVRSDGARINQILANLLSNAFKFTHQGGVKLDILPVVDGPHAGGVLLRVRDSGIGIPQEKLARIFQAFEQADSGTSRRYGGTGLGLSIVKALVELLGGEVRLESQQGQGSTFTVSLPAAAPGTDALSPEPAVSAVAVAAPQTAAVPSAAPAAALQPPAEPPGTTLLIVEDDAQFAEVLAGLARGRHYRALVARDGETGLALARKHRPAGILLDIGLPKMDGWQVMERLQADPLTAGIPVHFISGADAEGRARAAGAAGYLKKPVAREDVERVFDGLPGVPTGARRILIIDDNPADRRLVREMLRGESVQIDEVGSAEEAMDRTAQESYDLLILDLGLPGMDGFQFLERASARGPLPAVVIHSGRELTREEGLRLREYTETIVLKSAPSPQRLLDEVTLFLHSIRKVGAPVAAAPRAVAPGLSGKTVLVVDDDMRNIFALSKALRSRGLKVLMAQDGYKAIAQLESNPEVDLVLMDIMMPGMDGYETIRRIREKSEWQALPIIAVTAKAMVGDREKCLEAGANEYCSKPIDVEQLTGQMQALLGDS
ncbi:response regulator [Solimonas sp. SE-A11]|uniref:response regulator n=1 Tax=Solimonas sp. SE-A11 TaxID=3054954 RepID=UPI00259CE5F3|nr:response regulator [Solimonas sp. SE-A11]MDM4769409.1 response regulator [Solimonas sp. SE-A11]